MSPTGHHERPTPRVRAFRRESNTNTVFPARLPIGNWSTGARRSSRMHREEHRAPHCRGPLRKTRKAASWKNKKENPTADPRLGCECGCGIRWMCRAKSEARAQSSMAGKILRRRWHTPRKRKIKCAASGQEPDFIAVPYWPDARENLSPFFVCFCDEQVNGSGPQIEAV